MRATTKAPAGLDFGDGILMNDELGASRVMLHATEALGNARAGVIGEGALLPEVLSVCRSGDPRDLCLW